MRVLMAERPPHFMRAEVNGDGLRVIAVTNDAGSYLYMPERNQYTHEPRGAPAQVGAVHEDLLGEYKRLDHAVAAAKFLGRESVQLSGEARESVRVDVEYEPERTAAGADSTRRSLWIDVETGLVLKEQTFAHVSETPFGQPLQIHEETVFTRIDLDEPPQASFFAFQPPEGAERVEPDAQQPGEPVLRRGDPAPEFSLRTLDSRMIRLSDLQGELILVNFWATWCGPCRMEMPELEQLHRDYAKQGLRVLGINMGESEAVVRAYVQDRGYTFPILIDELAETGQRYRTHSLPTSIVIDRQGRIAKVLVGAHASETFREVLVEAGL